MSKNGVTLNIRLGGRSWSLKMAPFDRPYATFYWSAVVNIALSCTVCKLFDFEYYRDLEMWVRGYSWSSKLVPFESLGAVSYSPSIVTRAVSVAVCDNLESKSCMTLKTGLGFIQGHWK